MGQSAHVSLRVANGPLVGIPRQCVSHGTPIKRNRSALPFGGEPTTNPVSAVSGIQIFRIPVVITALRHNPRDDICSLKSAPAHQMP